MAQTAESYLNITPYQPSDDEEYMSAEQLTHFRGILENWKKKLMEDVDQTVDHMKTDHINHPDPLDSAAHEEEFAIELRTRDRERKLLKKIEQSLDDIARSDYGFCEKCGSEIGIRRLEARPTATQCIDCKTISEIQERQISS